MSTWVINRSCVCRVPIAKTPMAPFGQPNINRFSLEAPLLGIRPVITATLPAHAVTILGEASCRLPYSTPTRPAARGPETE